MLNSSWKIIKFLFIGSLYIVGNGNSNEQKDVHTHIHTWKSAKD